MPCGSSLAAQNASLTLTSRLGRLVRLSDGVVNAPSGVLTAGALAVGAASISTRDRPVAADDLPGSGHERGTPVIEWRGADQGFDDDNGASYRPGLDYHAEFYVKSQRRRLTRPSTGFPLFNQDPNTWRSSRAATTWDRDVHGPSEGPPLPRRTPSRRGSLEVTRDGGEDADTPGTTLRRRRSSALGQRLHADRDRRGPLRAKQYRLPSLKRLRDAVEVNRS